MTEVVRVCVLGNSHLAAAKAGWDLIASRYPGHALTFFGAPRNIMKDLVREGGRLVPRSEKLLQKIRRSSGGLDAVELAEYDVFVLYGLQFGPRRVIQLYRTHRPVSFEWREPLPDLPPMENRSGPLQTVSERIFDGFALNGLQRTLAVQLAAQIRAVSRRPIHLVAAPGFSEKVLDAGEWDGVLGSGDLWRLAGRYGDLAARACPQGATLHLPPPERVTHGLFTRREFASKIVAETGIDLVHTDAIYGAAMLENVLGAVQEAERGFTDQRLPAAS